MELVVLMMGLGGAAVIAATLRTIARDGYRAEPPRAGYDTRRPLTRSEWRDDR